MAAPKRTLDLSNLNVDEPVASAVNGQPVMLRLADIDPDPNQPRKTFTPEGMAEMVASIKEHGVLQPISVRPNLDKPGRWLINVGERRYRGSLEAGKEEIPAVVSEVFTDYGQVIENLQREDLTPFELALFIQRKKGEGEKNADIARKLGVDRAVVTHHLALIDAPAPIEQAYNAGKTTSAKTIYELRSLYEKHPDAVETWIEDAAEITRGAVQALAQKLKGNGKAPDEPRQTASAESVGHDQQNGGEGGDKPNGQDSTPSRKTDSAQTETGDGEGEDHGKLSSWPPGKVASDPDLIKKPLLLVSVAGRSAAVLLNRRPSESGRLRIRYEDNGADEEVAASECTIHVLVEQPK